MFSTKLSTILQNNNIDLEQLRCVECNKRFTDSGFQYYSGNIEYGPAYFSDEGTLCSPECALVHYKRRIEDGTWK